MSTNFQVTLQKHCGDIHLHPSGDFDGSSAFELIALINRHYNGSGEVVIDTSKLRKIFPFGTSIFRGKIKEMRIPKNRLCFKGEKGHDLAPEGCKVTETFQKQCCDGCANCVCSGATQHH